MEDVKPLHMYWLGTPHVVMDGKSVKFETRKALALLIYLSHEDRNVSRESLAALFWPEFSQQKAFANLRRNLASLYQSLSGDWLVATRETIGMANRQNFWLDTALFQQCASAAADDNEGTINSEKAEALYRGPFLEGFNLPDCPAFDDWQLFQREEYQREFTVLLQQIIRQYSSALNWESAIRYARKWVSLDRFHEPAQQTLTRLYLQAGQHSAAIQQFEMYQRLLRQEFNQDPGPEFIHLFKEMRSERPGKSISASPARTETVTGTADQSISSAQRQADDILKTKLFIPNIRQKRVERQHLIEQLNQGLDYRLILISAPAGYGKSTLLGSWVRQCPYPVAWLSLDSDDNDPLRYIKYITSAIQNVLPESLNLQENILPASLFAYSSATARNFLVSILNRLCEVDEPTFLILDDYHFIRNNDVNELTAFLIEKMPDQIHIIVSTRSDPMFPLARLRARGHILELRADDLRLTYLETEQFLNETMRLQLDVGAIETLEERTEGWIAGLQMASIAMQSNRSVGNRKNELEFIQGFSGTNRFILDYLMEEVLASQPAEIQHFLLSTSILDRLNAPLCDFLLNSDQQTGSGVEVQSPIGGGVQPQSPPADRNLLQSSAILDYLERENLFLVPLDEERAWFRYHHLFADLLKARLHQSRPDQISRLHHLASIWLEQHGYIHQAIQHRISANETSQAADLIEQYGPAHFAENDPSIFHMADNLPQEVITARPRLGLYQAWLLIIQGCIAKAHPLLHALARDCSSTAANSEQRWMQAVITSALAFLSPPPGIPGYVPLPDYHLLSEIPPEESILHDAADILYGMALGRRGELDRAVEVSISCIHREKSRKGMLDVPTMVPFLSRIYLILGRLHACYALCHEYLDPLQNQGIRFIYSNGSMQIDLGEVLFEWNCLEESERFIREGLLANETWRNIMTDGFGLVALARTLLAKGDFPGAMEACLKFETRLHEQAQPREFDEDLYTLRTRIQLASGDLQNPSRWVSEILDGEDFRVHPEYYRLILARIRLAQNRYADVEQILSGTVPAVSFRCQVARQIESDLVLAAAIAGQDRLSEALIIIENSLALAEQEELVRVFLEVGEPARALLDTYLQSALSGHKQYAHKILDLFPC